MIIETLTVFAQHMLRISFYLLYMLFMCTLYYICTY